MVISLVWSLDDYDDLMAYDALHCLNDIDRGRGCPIQFALHNSTMIATHGQGIKTQNPLLLTCPGGHPL